MVLPETPKPVLESPPGMPEITPADPADHIAITPLDRRTVEAGQLEQHAEQLRREVTLSRQSQGRNSIEGLHLEVGLPASANDPRAGVVEHYVVRKTFRKEDDIVEQRKTIIPRLQDGEPLIKKGQDGKWGWNGRNTWKREETPTKYRRRFIEPAPSGGTSFRLKTPKVVKHAGYGRIVEWPDEEIGTERVDYATVEIWDMWGKRKEVKDMPVAELYKTACKEGILGASWEDRTNTARTPAGTLRIDTPREPKLRANEVARKRKPMFMEITDELEARGITDWTGMNWERRPERDPRHLYKDKRMNAYETELQSVVKEKQEILRDEADHEDDPLGQEGRWVRKFHVRTVREFEDGSTKTTDHLFNDYELWQLFEESNPDATIDNDGLVMKFVQMPDADTDRYPLENVVSGLTPVDLDRPDNYEEALQMMAMRNVTYPDTEEGYAALSARIALADQSLGEELQETMGEVGFWYFDNVVKQLHDELYPELETAMEELGLQVSPAEEMDDWIAEELLERSRDLRARNVAIPLTGILQEPHILRSLIDEHIGERFAHESVLSKPAREQVGFDDDGKPKFSEHIIHTFNNDLFDVVPIRVSPSEMDKVRKQRNKIWGPIRKKTEDIYDQLTSDNPELTKEDTEELGRLLRRTIGQ